MRSLVKEIDTKGDGKITLNQFASFVNLDDHDPLFQSLFDRRRRNVNLLQVRAGRGIHLCFPYSHLNIAHISRSSWSTAPTTNRDTSNIWVLRTFLSM